IYTQTRRSYDVYIIINKTVISMHIYYAVKSTRDRIGSTFNFCDILISLGPQFLPAVRPCLVVFTIRAAMTRMRVELFTKVFYFVKIVFILIPESDGFSTCRYWWPLLADGVVHPDCDILTMFR